MATNRTLVERLAQESHKQWRAPLPRRPILAGTGRLRKIGILGGCQTIKYAPWHDPTWELWAHASCRMHCQREPDVLFDLHPPELWKSVEQKWWDTSYYRWLQQNHIPIYMQERYPDVPASIKYPFGTMITEFPRGYMTNTVAYMIALALMEGVTHIGIYGADYTGAAEYFRQRGSCEYWLGVTEGRGVQICLPPGCDLLNKPSLLYGYESHPGGKRHAQYGIGPEEKVIVRSGKKDLVLIPADAPNAPKLMNIGVPPALERRDELPMELIAQAKLAAADAGGLWSDQ